MQVTGGGNSDTVEPATEVAMECESYLLRREEITVMKFNAQSNTVTERVTGESLSSNQYTQNGKETVLLNLGSNDGALKSVVSVIDHANYADSSLLVKANRVTEKDVNSRVLNSDLIINAKPTETKELEAKSNSLGSTLSAPSHENHVPLKLEQIQQIQPTAKEGDQPKNIRSWKHIMRQPSPNETEVLSVAEKKNTSSTCMENTHDSPHKHLEIQNDQSFSSSMVEAAQQPRQEP